MNMNMNRLKIGLVVTMIVALASCSTTKKSVLLGENQKLHIDVKNCQDQLADSKSLNDKLNAKISSLQSIIDDLNKRLAGVSKDNTQILTTLQDISVMSAKQAESVKKSLEVIGAKDLYINGLQSAMARKDSLNMALVTNLKNAVGDMNDQDINIKVEKGVVYIDISDKILFNSGRYTVTEQARKVLGKVAKVLDAHPEIEFMVEGHTDNVPIYTDALVDNWDLSVKRATSVVRILQNEYHIKPSRMSAAGRSEYLPIAANNEKNGRSLNRRTRIVILPQLDQFFDLLVKKDKTQ
jgi:chemotaxis protein MotB